MPRGNPNTRHPNRLQARAQVLYPGLPSFPLTFPRRKHSPLRATGEHRGPEGRRTISLNPSPPHAGCCPKTLETRGMRSAPPRCEASRESKHNVIIGAMERPVAQWGQSSGASEVSFTGVRSPPLRGETIPYGWPSGEDLGPTRKAVFSEGRTLCARIARHHEWQGLSLPPVVRREAGGLMGIHGEGVRRSSRACGARPSTGSLPKEDCLRGAIRSGPKPIFSEGRALRARPERLN